MSEDKQLSERARRLEQKYKRKSQDPGIEVNEYVYWDGTVGAIPTRNISFDIEPELFFLDVHDSPIEYALTKVNVSNWDNPIVSKGTITTAHTGGGAHPLTGDSNYLYFLTRPNFSVKLKVKARGEQSGPYVFLGAEIYIHNGTSETYLGKIWQPGTSYGIYTFSISSIIIPTLDVINNCKVKFRLSNADFGYDIFITYAYLEVTIETIVYNLPVNGWTGETSQWDKQGTSPYLNTDDGDTNCIRGDQVGETDAYYLFSDLTFDASMKPTLWKVNRNNLSLNNYLMFDPQYPMDDILESGGFLLTCSNRGKLFKITPSLEISNSFQFPGDIKYSGSMRLDRSCYNLLWISFVVDSDWKTRLFKFNLDNFSIVEYKDYSLPSGRVMGQDKDYIYLLHGYYDILKVKKKDLNNYSSASLASNPAFDCCSLKNNKMFFGSDYLFRYDALTLTKDYQSSYLDYVYLLWIDNTYFYVIRQYYFDIGKFSHNGSFVQEGSWKDVSEPNTDYLWGAFSDGVRSGSKLGE